MLQPVRGVQLGRFEERDERDQHARADLAAADESSLAFSLSFPRFAKRLARYDHARLREAIPVFPPSMSGLIAAKVYGDIFDSVVLARAGDLDAARARIAEIDPTNEFVRAETVS